MTAVKLGSNIISLTAQRRLSDNARDLSRTFERLSSGLRINRASDDAAGQAVAAGLAATHVVYKQAVRNLKDGSSLVSIAESALASLSNLTTRLKELASQAANESFTSAQRVALDHEAQALAAEYERISTTTTFNGQAVFSELRRVTLQAGEGEYAAIQGDLGEIGTTITISTPGGPGGMVGDGTFGSARSYAADSTSSAVTLGDVNNDGILDLVTGGDSGPGQAIVRLGIGDGTFGNAATYGMEENSVSDVALYDLNGDGNLDLVTSGQSASSEGFASVRLGAGNGTFGVRVSYAMGNNAPSGVALGDLNGDGKVDLVTTGTDSPIAGVTYVRLGVGDGAFNAATSYNAETLMSFDVTLGDLNGDGYLDLITAGEVNTPTAEGFVTVRLGTGSGTFGSATSYSTQTITARAVQVGDINGDGKLDVVTAGTQSGGKVTVRLGVGDGTFGVASTYAAEGSASNGIALEDLNADGNLDLITAGRVAGVSSYATIRLGAGDGSFGAAASYQTETSSLGSYDVVIGDLNGDGAPDVVTAGSATASILLAQTTVGSGPPALSDEFVAGLPAFSLLTVEDALIAFNQFEQVSDALAVQQGNVGAFQSRISHATSAAQSVADNSQEAAWRITDADVAQELSRMARLKILQYGGAALLAQANQQPELVLKLIA